MTSLIYRSSTLYEAAMVALYGWHYSSRYRAVADLIPQGSSVVDLCCGPAILYHRYLRQKSIRYTGLDSSEKFVSNLTRLGATGVACDLRQDAPLPTADYLVMQGSLFYFLPDASKVIDRMICAARERVIIAEPIRNVATSKWRLLALGARLLTNPGLGDTHALRFNEASLDRLFSRYSSKTKLKVLIAGGREKMYVLGV